MDEINKLLNLNSNLDLPCIRAVIYKKSSKDFTDYFTNNSYNQGHYKMIAL